MFFNIFGKTRKNRSQKSQRKGPTVSATGVSEGAIEWGNDKGRWVAKRVGGSQRWVPFHSAAMFGYAPLTAAYLAKHIGKPVAVYERAMMDKWPRSPKDFDVKYVFIATGATEAGDTVYPKWLKTQKPPVGEDELMIVEGTLKSRDYAGTIQVGTSGLISTNLMNSEAFVKC